MLLESFSLLALRMRAKFLSTRADFLLLEEFLEDGGGCCGGSLGMAGEYHGAARVCGGGGLPDGVCGGLPEGVLAALRPDGVGLLWSPEETYLGQWECGLKHGFGTASGGLWPRPVEVGGGRKVHSETRCLRDEYRLGLSPRRGQPAEVAYRVDGGSPREWTEVTYSVGTEGSLPSFGPAAVGKRLPGEAPGRLVGGVCIGCGRRSLQRRDSLHRPVEAGQTRGRGHPLLPGRGNLEPK